MTTTETETKRCAVCSVGPRHGPMPDVTPHASWCPNRAQHYTGPRPSAKVGR